MSLVTASVAASGNAGALNVTVHVATAGVVREEGVQAAELKLGSEATVSVPRLETIARDPASGEAATMLVTAMGIVPNAIDGIAVTVAMTPSVIGILFIPETRH